MGLHWKSVDFDKGCVTYIMAVFFIIWLYIWYQYGNRTYILIMRAIYVQYALHSHIIKYIVILCADSSYYSCVSDVLAVYPILWLCDAYFSWKCYGCIFYIRKCMGPCIHVTPVYKLNVEEYLWILVKQQNYYIDKSLGILK